VVPQLKPFRREVRTRARGQLVAAVAPGGVLVAAGVRRGDLITAVDGSSAASPGAFAAIQRRLPAEQNVTLTLRRGGRSFQAVVKLRPDWTQLPDYGKSLTVITRRSPTTFSAAYARARQLIDANRPAEAAALIRTWPRSWRTSSVGELIAGDLGVAIGKWKAALGSYNRARFLDPALALAEFGRGTALAELGKNRASVNAFQAAVRLDPVDPAAYAFQAYALLRADRLAEAVVAAREAVKLDPNYAEGQLALGIAMIQSGAVPAGRTTLRKGLILLDDAGRAARLIVQSLNPTDP
jgi:tetratricopeptide (TPR) repeat protein